MLLCTEISGVQSLAKGFKTQAFPNLGGKEYSKREPPFKIYILFGVSAV